MKTKRFINGLALAFSAVMTMLFVGCNPEQPENEKENKLHEDPVRAVFTHCRKEHSTMLLPSTIRQRWLTSKLLLLLLK